MERIRLKLVAYTKLNLIHLEKHEQWTSSLKLQVCKTLILMQLEKNVSRMKRVRKIPSNTRTMTWKIAPET